MILAGGVGSRFWPVSTPARPKQLLPLAGERAMIVETVRRIAPIVPSDRLRILTGRHLAEPILEMLPDLDTENLMLEPRARGTAPVLVWAAHEIVAHDPDAVMVSLHADHVIAPDDAFRERIVELARLAAERHALFTIGVSPTRPETGYGYIRVGDPIDEEAGIHEVGDFVEKPDPDTAREYLRRGGYLWNSGLFIWPARTLLDEIRRHTPELANLLPLLDAGDVEAFFRRAPDLSIDEGMLERSDRVAVGRATFRWDDVGQWDAVGRTHPTDEAGNVAVGDVHLVDAERCIAWADEGAVIVFGGRDLVVVRTGDITLVAPRDRAAELKHLLGRLPDELREPEAEE
ncbi:MAG: mannose-1-phosphate guanylyltransferase [Gemmatimonadota bacterium]